jgi:hypothetical protein
MRLPFQGGPARIRWVTQTRRAHNKRLHLTVRCAARR